MTIKFPASLRDQKDSGPKPHVLRYAITDRRLHPGSENDRRSAVVQQAVRLCGLGVDYLQLREKDLSPQELLDLAIRIRDAVDMAPAGNMRLLLNGSPEIAQKSGFDGVHLPASVAAIVPPEQIASMKHVSVSCHSLQEVERSCAYASILLFAPVFGKSSAGIHVRDGSGLVMFGEACRIANPIPVLALGGVTRQNTPLCLAQGASGVAGIRLFLDGGSL